MPAHPTDSAVDTAPRPGRWAPVAAAAVLAGAILAGGVVFEVRIQHEVRALAVDQLSATATLLAGRIEAWRSERLADATAIAAPPVSAAELAGMRRGELPAHLVAWLNGIAARHTYANVIVAAPDGTLLHAATPLRALEPEAAALVVAVSRAGRPALSDAYRGAPDGRVYVDAAAPIGGASGSAVLLLRADAESFLYPLLRTWPIPTATAESYLVRRDGEDVVYVTPMRGVDAAPLAYREPLGGGGAGPRAASGTVGTVELDDDHGRRSLAVIVPIPGSTWRLVASRGADEVFATERLVTWVFIGSLALILALAAGGGALWWRAAAARRTMAERRVVEEALRSRAEVLDAMSDAVVATDPAGRITAWNPAATATYGYPEEEALGRELHDLLRTEFPHRLRREDVIAALEREGRVNLSARQRRKDGARLDIDAVLVYRRAPDGAFLGCIGVNRDVTARRRSEEELRRANERLALADRLASLGTLAAGVAHEINNPLAYVLANLTAADEMAAALGDGAEPLREALRDARDGGERVRRIVAEMRTLARAGEEERRGPVDVRRVLETALNLARHELKHRARVAVEHAPVPPVDGNEARLVQVFVNLLVNAAQALPEGEAARNEIRIATACDAGRVRVTVSDTGAGIPPDVLGRIFDPFFTTKPVGVGTGLGLAICHGIVTSLGGEITVDSRRGEGTTFTVLLPAAGGDAAGAEEPAGTDAAARSRRGRILVVDDEALVLHAVRRVLGREHDVVTVGSGQAALDLFAAGERFDAVVCDLMMPEVTGMDVHERIARAVPAAAETFLFMTGGAFTPRARIFMDEPGRRGVEKPFDPERLREAVRRIVSG